MSRRRARFFGLFALILACSAAKASTIITSSGNFLFDSDVQFFAYTSPTPGMVTVNTSSFADGGFAPILVLYSSTGQILFTADGPANNDCGVANQADILGTGYCYDTQITWDSLAGVNYYVALSEYDNFPLADIPVNLSPTAWNNIDTFTEFGNNFFSTGPPFGPGCGQSQGFCLDDGHARGNNWFVTFTGPTGLTARTPETSSIFLVLGGLALLCGRLLRMRKTRLKQSIRPGSA